MSHSPVQELRTGLGPRQSFIRKPGTEQVLVRIGIGRDGMYKVDGMENKVRGQNILIVQLMDWVSDFTIGRPNNSAMYCGMYSIAHDV